MNNKKSNKGDRMTIGKLAIMVAKGFESVERRMVTKDDLKLEIESVKNLIEGTNKRIDDLSSNRVKYEVFDVLKKRVDKLERV